LENDYQKLYSEHHLQAYLVEHTLTAYSKKRYRKQARNILPFIIPDLVICKTKRIMEESKNPKENLDKIIEKYDFRYKYIGNKL